MIPLPGRQGGANGKAGRTFVYLLQSLTAKRSYVGWTTDIGRRLEEHNAGRSLHTSARGPWRLIGYESFGNLTEAKQRERMLKRHPRQLTQFKKRMTNVFRTASGGPGQVVG